MLWRVFLLPAKKSQPKWPYLRIGSEVDICTLMMQSLLPTKLPKPFSSLSTSSPFPSISPSPKKIDFETTGFDETPTSQSANYFNRCSPCCKPRNRGPGVSSGSWTQWTKTAVFLAFVTSFRNSPAILCASN